MTDPVRPADQTTIEDIDPPQWDRTAPVPDPVAPPSPSASAAAPAASRRRLGARWLVALIGVIVVIGGSAVVVSLAAGRPAPSIAIGYMPDSTVMYAEARLDLPGDQRQKLGSFLKTALPGFDDQAQLDTKLNELLDRLTRSATDGKQTWTTDIAPWFGGQLAIGVKLPDASAPPTTPPLSSPSPLSSPFTNAAVTLASTHQMAGMGGKDAALLVATITDRAKAGAWLQSSAKSPLGRSTYNGADLFTPSGASGGEYAIAVTDKVMLAGTQAAVKAAVDTNGTSSFADNDDVKAALATIDRDNVGFSLVRTRAYLEGVLAMADTIAASPLAKTQIDETLLGMIPAWQTTSVRFENDALSFASSSPAWTIGSDTTNRASRLLGHVPAKTVAYAEAHDVGQTLESVLGKFRALPEAKPAFDAFDQALALVGGADAVYGWWGDAGVAVTPLANGTIGAGLLVQPNDPAAAKRLFDVLTADLKLAGSTAGITVRTEDHNGTTITVADLSGVSGLSSTGLPAGYKAEIAWATNDQVAVVGFGRDFVAAVLDAGPGSSLADDARFKSLLQRVGAENISLSYVDIAGIRGLIEPLVKQQMTPEKWAEYQTEYRPYLDHFDALIGAVRKDGSVDRGSSQLTVH